MTVAKEFTVPFHDDPVVESFYILELEKFLELALTKNIKTRVLEHITVTVVNNQNKMVEGILDYLPPAKREPFLENVPIKGYFQIIFHIETLAHMDFKNDVTFQFSFGLFYWFRKYFDSYSKLSKQLGHKQNKSDSQDKTSR